LFGWYAEGTGFTRVLRELLPHLAQHYRITWMGVGYKGQPRQLGPDVLLLPTNLAGGDLVGAYGARLNWASLEADAVLALNDVWYLEHYSRELASLLGHVPMLGYLPLDGDIPEPHLIEGLVGFHSLYTYTQHAAEQLRGALHECAIPTPVAVAGHGVDVSAFAPTESVRAADFDAGARMRLAQQLFDLPEPSWVVLNASRPDPRKRIDLSIEGFARFARERPSSVRLCLHHAIAYPQFVEPLRQQAAALGLEDRILWWPPREAPLDDGALCALYNGCAVGINTSVGEGFGLVSFEHGATGAPQVLPDHAALRELWGEAAVRLGPVRPVRTAFSPLVMGEVDADQVSAGLGRLYEDEDLYRRFARGAYERSQSPDLRWSVPAEVLLRGLREALRSS
jgi:glycosyltransferase involved in cell wall biosynthesis